MRQVLTQTVKTVKMVLRCILCHLGQYGVSIKAQFFFCNCHTLMLKTIRVTDKRPSSFKPVIIFKTNNNLLVDGKASEKSAAKRVAATKMLERLTNDCLNKKMISHITPFTDFEMKEAIKILCETERYDEMLGQICAERRKKPPLYEIENSKISVRVRCSALGLQGFGIYTNSTLAKRAAARDILLQFKQKPKY